MKLFRVLVLVVALLAGGIAAFLALNLEPGTPAAPVVELAPQIQSQDVLVAAADISQGQKLTAENIRWQRWPDDAMNPSYIQKQTTPDASEKLLGSIVRSQFVAGEPIRDVKLARPDSGFMAAILPSGMRAIAVRVSAQNTAGGFILPNDRVDVVQTIASEDGQSVSKTILTNVKILAVDQTVEEKDGEAVVVGKTVTLELAPAQVELVTKSEASGTLSLALRSYADAAEQSVVLREGAKAGPGPRTSSTVRIFRNGQVEEQTMGVGATRPAARKAPAPEPADEPDQDPDADQATQ